MRDDIPMPDSKSGGRWALPGWVALSFSAALPAVFFSPRSWYAQIEKPWWHPPGWLFGPVWSVLYLLMAVAAWLVSRDGGWKVHGSALRLFLVQWLLNALWTPLFFGLHRPDLAFAEIVVFWVALVVTLVAFWSARRVAGMLLIPYLAWVTFAAFLNLMLWRMNPV